MINTLIVKNPLEGDMDGLKAAADLLRKGEVVAFPTETVYGLGGNALSEDAASKIYIAKGRPSDNPLIVHIVDVNDLYSLVEEIPEVAWKLIDKFWPGPLTMIMKKSDKIPTQVTAGLQTVAIRMPSHKVARELIRLSGVPIAAPSANLSGKPSPTSCDHVIEDLNGKVSAVVCGDVSEVGLESTVLDITGERPMILRPGGVTYEMLVEVVGEVDYDPAIVNVSSKNKIIPKSPGMKYTHYSPEAEVILAVYNNEEFTAKVKEAISTSELSEDEIGIMCSDEAAKHFDGYKVRAIGPYEDLEKIASNLFDGLRYFDTTDVKVIYTQGFPTIGIGSAIMNRLSKAAGHNKI